MLLITFVECLLYLRIRSLSVSGGVIERLPVALKNLRQLVGVFYPPTC